MTVPDKDLQELVEIEAKALTNHHLGKAEDIFKKHNVFAGLIEVNKLGDVGKLFKKKDYPVTRQSAEHSLTNLCFAHYLVVQERDNEIKALKATIRDLEKAANDT